MATGDTASTGPLAERLDHLFRTVLRPDGRAYTVREVCQAINDTAGTPVLSPGYLTLLRSGKRGATARTSRSKLLAIAEFFGVPVAYFDDPETAARIDTQLAAITALRDAGVRAIATHAEGLSPEALEAILAVVVQIRRASGLPPVNPTGQPES